MSVISVQATAPGRGAVAVVEVVGHGAAAIVGGMFDGPLPAPGRTAVGRLAADGPLDEVLLCVIPPGESFSGEETAEIHCHGGRVVAERIVRELGRRGAARAERGDVIERAVANGCIDRIQAEAHELLPVALTERAARMLLDQAGGALSRAVREGRDVLDTAPLGIALASPATIVLAGRPNVGKSTLFNALLEEDRVIVSEEAGTTRDPVREWIAFEGIPFRLCDTAGVEEGRRLDLLESLSAESARRETASADLLLFLHECPEGARPEEERFLERSGRPAVRVAAKCDLGGQCPGIRVSGRTGEGLAQLRSAILEALKLDRIVPSGAPVVFTRRQQELLQRGEGEDLFS